MKRFLIGLSIALSVFQGAYSEPWDPGTKRESGSYVQSTSVTVTTYTATALFSADGNVANLDIFNNSAYTLWVGSNTTTLQTTGFPILSSKTYTLDGRFAGVIYGLGNSTAAGNTNVRVIRYLMKE